MSWWETLTSMNDSYTGNIAALILIFMLIAANFGKMKTHLAEDKALMHLLGNVGLYSILEIVSVILDGVPGTGMTALLYIINSYLYVINILLGFGWVQFIALHLGYDVKKRTRRLLQTAGLCGIILLAVNVFSPVVFGLKGNRYTQDGPLYFVFLLIAGIYFAYTVYMYMICRRDGGAIKYFPVWMYVVPSLLGIFLETLLGSSYMCVCNATAFAAVLAGLREEEVLRDKLTGLYNRAYLEILKGRLEKLHGGSVSGIMLDLNGFKHINDEYGHAEGDEALVTASALIRGSVGRFGDVIRYAGDEFVVIVNTRDETAVRECAARISDAFSAYNMKKEKPYKLSASMGFAGFDASRQTVNEFMNTIDKNMYEAKKEYYAQNVNDRRKR